MPILSGDSLDHLVTPIYLPPLLTDWLGCCSCTGPHSKDPDWFPCKLYCTGLGWAVYYRTLLTTTSVEKITWCTQHVVNCYTGNGDPYLKLLCNFWWLVEETNSFKVNGLIDLRDIE